jgi:hypothetical protein
MFKIKTQVAEQQRRKRTTEFKTKVALAALREGKTMAELRAHYSAHPDQTARQLRLGARHHLYPGGQGLCLPDSRGRCGKSLGTRAQGRDDLGGAPRGRNHGRSHCPPWHTGRRQHRSGRSVYSRSIHRRGAKRWHQAQHGWQRRLTGQRLRRAAMAYLEIRLGVLEGLQPRARCAYCH